MSKTLTEEDLKRKIPANFNAEQMLLGAILINSDLIEQVSEFLKPEHFYEPLHQKIYNAIEILNEKGLVELKAKKTFTLDMPGFAEVYPSTSSITTDQGFELRVCSLPGVVLLKLIAWEDRNHRTKDIQDIEYIIRNLYLLEIEEIASTNGDLLDLLDNETNYTESVTARYIGRVIGAMLKDSTALLNRVEQLLMRNIQDTDNSPMGKVMSFDTLAESIQIIEQIYLGIQDKTS